MACASTPGRKGLHIQKPGEGAGYCTKRRDRISWSRSRSTGLAGEPPGVAFAFPLPSMHYHRMQGPWPRTAFASNRGQQSATPSLAALRPSCTSCTECRRMLQVLYSDYALKTTGRGLPEGALSVLR